MEPLAMYAAVTRDSIQTAKDFVGAHSAPIAGQGDDLTEIIDYDAA